MADHISADFLAFRQPQMAKKEKIYKKKASIMVMNPLRNFPHGAKPKATFTAAFIFLLSFLSPKSVSGEVSDDDKNFFEMKLGSSPPACANKCFNCRPCMATLVLIDDSKKPPRAALNNIDLQDYIESYYYAQVWKCKCGDKIYDP
ncbi:EPIDERMAL PATTERNING FACTOR-like protein 8 isoform X2 [Mangifera indica]|uniref:EPIDERMAL PATTERNING FACTOR-like protein 8 isoform X2 n=1 Tax=Mangifera indica TaxID=29780 RepID=UPI001CFBF80C|nr:EPIDERMAL PATTERNING FACTOR-like protein 8 isoform X2 [Mangifera indica]